MSDGLRADQVLLANPPQDAGEADGCPVCGPGDCACGLMLTAARRCAERHFGGDGNGNPCAACIKWASTTQRDAGEGLDEARVAAVLEIHRSRTILFTTCPRDPNSGECEEQLPAASADFHRAHRALVFVWPCPTAAAIVADHTP